MASPRLNVGGDLQVTNHTTTLGLTLPLAVVTAATVAINPHESRNIILSRSAGVSATLAAPISGIDDGIFISISAIDNGDHAVVFPSNILFAGTSAITTISWPGQNGGSAEVMAYGGKWVLQSAEGVTLS